MNDKLAVLREVWDESFPPADYPFQRLTREGASKLLAGGRSVEEVQRAILDAPSQASSKIQNPLSYVLAILQSMERKKSQQHTAPQEDGGVGITDDIRKLTEMGRRMFGGNADTPET